MDIGFNKNLLNRTEDILSRNLVQGDTKVVRSKISLFSYLCCYYINIEIFYRLQKCLLIMLVKIFLSANLLSTSLVPAIKRRITDNTLRELLRRRSLVADRLLREVFRRFCLRTAILRTGYARAIYKRTRALARSFVTAISCAIKRAPSEDLCSRACNTSVYRDGYTCRSVEKG